MECFENRTKLDRRSICMPVPTIVLNTSANEKSEQAALVHSRSDGDLDMTVVDPAAAECSAKFLGSDADEKLHEEDQAIGLYCSPRISRRSGSANDASLHQCGMFVDSLNACSLNCLGPGSRVGSTISLNSEYTSRSVGLISNDSLSECCNICCNVGVMDGSSSKHGVLKRFHSSPERDDDVLQYTSNVRRSSRSMGNMQEDESFACFEFGSDSADDNNTNQNDELCHVDNALAQRTAFDEAELPSERSFVTSVTGGAALREGRIRKWLTEISDPVENFDS